MVTKISPLHKYLANNICPQGVEHCNYFGLCIWNTLSWTQHIDSVTGKAQENFFSMLRSLKSSILNARPLAQNTVHRPMVEYAVVIWDQFTNINVNKLQTLQKKQ